MGLLCVCAIFRIKHVAKKISLLASRMPVQVEFFRQFSQYRHLGFVHKTTYLWSMRSPGGWGIVSFCVLGGGE